MEHGVWLRTNIGEERKRNEKKHSLEKSTLKIVKKRRPKSGHPMNDNNNNKNVSWQSHLPDYFIMYSRITYELQSIAEICSANMVRSNWLVPYNRV